MDWIESIKNIRKAQENNQLVVFVGAGVSKNSGLPSWRELINSIADKIGYYHETQCFKCEKQNEECPKDECEKKYAFSQDEFLRIPEYFFQMDTSKDHEEYYKFISDKLNSNQKSNLINYEIFNLLPHHIITTNYDNLLETSDNEYTNLYATVSKDEDLLSNPNDKYLIKMHGGLDCIQKIVLKESDYIDYEQEHPLISTFIRSILVNHSFLFLGYSLNDYNLNLIIGWINYFKKKYEVNERPKSFLIDCNDSSDFERKRQESKNIFVINISDIPTDLLNETGIQSQIDSEEGQRLYAYLHAITSPEIIEKYVPLEKTLVEKYEVLDSYNKISFYDLTAAHHLGNSYFCSTELVFYDEKWYQRMKLILQSGDKKLNSYFNRSGITAIHNHNNDEYYEIENVDEIHDSIFELYLNNNYVNLKEKLDAIEDSSEKLYYYHFLGYDQLKIASCISNMYQEMTNKDFISILLCKMRERLTKLSLFDRQEAITKEINNLFDTAPGRYRNVIGSLRRLFFSPSEHLVKMQEILDKQEIRNKYGRNGWESGPAFIHIWKLQAYAYDYYYFFKRNYLPLDYFNSASQYFSFYIQAILCSYIPTAPADSMDAFGITTDHEEYPINDIDLDIIVKYVDSKSLESWLQKYSVKSLDISGCHNVEEKFTNLCESYIELSNKDWINQIKNFSVIICLANIDIQIKERIFSSFIAILEKSVKKSVKQCEALFDLLYYLTRHLNINLSDGIVNRMLSVLLNENVYNVIKQNNSTLFNILKQYGKNISDELQRNQIEFVEGISTKEDKIKEIYQRRFILPSEIYDEDLKNNIDFLSTDDLFNLLIEGRIEFTSQIQKYFIDKIESLDKDRKDHPNMRTYPDWLSITIGECIILKLFDFSIDITLLSPYVEYSLQLQFMINPEEFDYSKVNINDYMWQNLIYDKHYKQYFINKKEMLLSLDLKEVFNRKLDTREQQKIVYGLLLDDEELRRF